MRDARSAVRSEKKLFMPRERFKRFLAEHSALTEARTLKG